VFDYFGFEERFRGPEDEIKDRHRRYLGYFPNSGRVVDIGCGRGEFLELLRDAGVEADGIDLDLDMVLCCREKGLRVTHGDLFSWLGAQPDVSLGGVFGAQVIEHMRPEEVVQLVTLCHRKLATGGHLLLESVNPGSLSALASFYLDFTHVRPLHPEGMRFLFESVGFSGVEVRYSAFTPAALQLPDVPDILGGAVAPLVEAIRRLNGFLYGPGDYAVVGRKLRDDTE
jgi:O-antigen chain-terminating methyltransferase